VKSPVTLIKAPGSHNVLRESGFQVSGSEAMNQQLQRCYQHIKRCQLSHLQHWSIKVLNSLH